MLRELLAEYKDGIVSSLQGFLLLHKLDKQDGHTVNETRRSSNDIVTKQTVLEHRRRKNMEKKSVVETQKQTQRKVSTIYRVFFCAFINILLVIIIMGLTFVIDWLSYFPNYLKYFGSVLLIVPVLIVRCLSTLWFADVASAALRYRRLSGTKINVFSRAASDFLHAIFVELVFLVQVIVITCLDVPIVSSFLGFVCMSLLNSLYSFDYIWMARGVSMNARLAFMENRWPFHLGFGTLITIATSISPNFIINGLIFGALFPFFIVSSCLADSSKATGEPGDEISHIPFFYIAQTITNKISVMVFGRFC